MKSGSLSNVKRADDNSPEREIVITPSPTERKSRI
jgi:hypothetical protein